MKAELKPVEWKNNLVVILDQTLLPFREEYIKTSDYREVVSAIRRLAVRGAPAIGIAAAYAVAAGAHNFQGRGVLSFIKNIYRIIQALADSRPTARNLFWVLERLQKIVNEGQTVADMRRALVNEAQQIHEEQIVTDRYISQLGAKLFERGGAILTHCNAGALATGGFGTALGVIKQAYAEGKAITVIATETRPLLQGARLTAFELQKAGIPFTLITDSMAGSFMRQGKIQAVITGADRIASNGDTANKIGTYSLAVLAKEHGIPFYVAAPMSTVDLSIASGQDIIIEERPADEVTTLGGTRIVKRGVKVANPAFDMPPHEYITAIVTENGIMRGEYEKGFAKSRQ